MGLEIELMPSLFSRNLKKFVCLNFHEELNSGCAYLFTQRHYLFMEAVARSSLLYGLFDLLFDAVIFMIVNLITATRAIYWKKSQ